MDHNDWVAATGSTYVGLGPAGFRRPPNPTLLAAALGKSHKPVTAKPRPKHGRAWRAAQLAIARATAPLETPRTPTRSGVALWELNQPGEAGRRAYARHVAVLQRWHGLR
jgi:hypothetical protein